MKRFSFDPLYELKGTAQVILLASISICTFVTLSWVVIYLPHGFDFADESLHIVSMADPFEYDFAVTLFGFVLHPVYLFLDGNIPALRFWNLIFLFVLAFILCFIYFQTVLPEMMWSRSQLGIISAGAATVIFMYYDSWQPSPSYNSLALQGVLLSSIGLLLASQYESNKGNLAYVILGVGGWLTFMTKPTSAIGLAVATVVFLIVLRNFRMKQVAIAVGTALLLLVLSAILIDGSLVAFSRRLLAGFELMQFMQTKHGLANSFRIDMPRLSHLLVLNICTLSLVTLFAVYCLASQIKVIYWLGLTLCALFFGAAVSIITLHQYIDLKITSTNWSTQGLFIFGAILPPFVLPLLIKGKLYYAQISRKVWALSGLLAVCPHIYASGTVNNMWMQGSSAAVFWFLSSLTILTPLINSMRSKTILLPLIIAAQFSTVALIQTGMQSPARQPFPIWTFNTSISFRHSDASILIDRGFSDFILDARATAKTAGFASETPLIDLSGASPGILYALEAKSIGLPWMIGRHAGSLNFAQAALERVNCEKIGAAWVLLEPNGPRSISSDMLTNLGIDFPTSYELMGQWKTAFGRANHKEISTQMLYRPINSEVIAQACTVKRKLSAP